MDGILAKFLAVFERIADALEVIASSPVLGNPGADAPRADDKPADKVADKPADKPADKAPTAAEKKAAKEAADKAKAAEKAKAVEADPLGDDAADPLAGGSEKKSYDEKDVRAILAKVIDKEGRAAAFEILAKQGGGAKAFTDLKPEKYEDVYVECEQRLA